MNEDAVPTTPVLLTFRQFADRHPAFSESSLRWTRFNEDRQGFATAFVTVASRRVLIWEKEFFRVIARQNCLDGESFNDGRAS